jgi:serine/threonine-protein kinase RsbW
MLQQPPSPAARVTLNNQREAIDRLEESIIRETEGHGYPKASRFAIRLSLDEAITNAFKHGHRQLPQELPITIEYAVRPDEVYLAIEDQGPGFDPSLIADPTTEENIERLSGRGVILIRAYMSDVRFSPRGNRIEMRYRRPDSAGTS